MSSGSGLDDESSSSSSSYFSCESRNESRNSSSFEVITSDSVSNVEEISIHSDSSYNYDSNVGIFYALSTDVESGKPNVYDIGRKKYESSLFEVINRLMSYIKNDSACNRDLVEERFEKVDLESLDVLNDYIEKSVQFIESEKYMKALDVIDDIIRLNIATEDAMLNKAICYYKLEYYSSALQLALRSVSRSRQYQNCVVAALCYLKLGRVVDAEYLLRMVYFRNPSIDIEELLLRNRFEALRAYCEDIDDDIIEMLTNSYDSIAPAIKLLENPLVLKMQLLLSSNSTIYQQTGTDSFEITPQYLEEAKKLTEDEWKNQKLFPVLANACSAISNIYQMSDMPTNIFACNSFMIVNFKFEVARVTLVEWLRRCGRLKKMAYSRPSHVILIEYDNHLSPLVAYEELFNRGIIKEGEYNFRLVPGNNQRSILEMSNSAKAEMIFQAKECPNYRFGGECRFGSACKYTHHPPCQKVDAIIYWSEDEEKAAQPAIYRSSCAKREILKSYSTKPSTIEKPNRVVDRKVSKLKTEPTVL